MLAFRKCNSACFSSGCQRVLLSVSALSPPSDTSCHPVPHLAETTLQPPSGSLYSHAPSPQSRTRESLTPVICARLYPTFSPFRSEKRWSVACILPFFLCRALLDSVLNIHMSCGPFSLSCFYIIFLIILIFLIISVLYSIACIILYIVYFYLPWVESDMPCWLLVD